MARVSADKDETVTGRVSESETAEEESTWRKTGDLSRNGEGLTKIADVVVQKIASLSAREVPGVRDLGGGAARTIGALRGRIPGGGTSHGQGVTVEVGERQVAVDLDLLIEFGVGIPALAREVRRNVITAIEEMTGLQVIEVNITIVDVFLDDEGDAEPTRARVE